ncbi:MAG: hypothetical protein GXO90_02950 [FCB group bacterium]|nr:hypothetical protein [FCB group bacterium]
MPIRFLFFILLMLGGCSSFSINRSIKHSVVRFSQSVLPEASGIIPSRITPGIFWLINDSGNPPALVAMDNRGKVITNLKISGVTNTDWESLTLGPKGKLVIGDLGNNLRLRTDQALVFMDEPDPARPVVTNLQVLPLVFNDLAPYGDHTPNVEALFTVGGQFWMLTKRRDDRSLLCRIEVDFDSSTAMVKPIQTITIPGLVTGADYHADRRELAILTYTAVYLFAWKSDSPHLNDRPVKMIPIFFKQAEGICWEGNTLRIVNEQGEMKVISTN